MLASPLWPVSSFSLTQFEPVAKSKLFGTQFNYLFDEYYPLDE